MTRFLPKKIPLATLIALLASCAANAALWYSATTVGGLKELVKGSGGQMQTISLPVTVLATAFGVVLAAALAFLLHLVVRKRAVLLWRVVVVAVTLLSCWGPFTIPQVGSTTLVALEAMHLVVGAMLVFAFGLQATAEDEDEPHPHDHLGGRLNACLARGGARAVHRGNSNLAIA